jgi:hypothetical protein
MEFPGMSIVHTAVTHMEISPAGTLKYKTGMRRQIFPCEKYLVSMSGMSTCNESADGSLRDSLVGVNRNLGANES